MFAWMPGHLRQEDTQPRRLAYTRNVTNPVFIVYSHNATDKNGKLLTCIQFAFAGREA
jgi:hypothetical protein